MKSRIMLNSQEMEGLFKGQVITIDEFEIQSEDAAAVNAAKVITKPEDLTPFTPPVDKEVTFSATMQSPKKGRPPKQKLICNINDCYAELPTPATLASHKWGKHGWSANGTKKRDSRKILDPFKRIRQIRL